MHVPSTAVSHGVRGNIDPPLVEISGQGVIQILKRGRLPYFLIITKRDEFFTVSSPHVLATSASLIPTPE